MKNVLNQSAFFAKNELETEGSSGSSAAVEGMLKTMFFLALKDFFSLCTTSSFKRQ